MTHTIHTGDSAELLKQYPDCYFDSVITDPPYGIEFLGKDWDTNTGAMEIWRECLRVLKPGGYLLAFSAARTYHHLATNIETVGFEIRDQIMWIYSSGFPKAQDIGKSIQRRQGVEETMSLEEYEKLTGVTNLPNGNDTFGHNNDTDGQKPAGLSGKITVCTSPEARQWEGWKTALKPAHEPIVMARKPFKGSTIDCVLTHGVGALNIDASRIDWDDKALQNIQRQNALGGEIVGGGIAKYSSVGEDADAKHDTQRIQLNEQGRFPSNVLGEIEGYQKYFYCPKVSRKERHCGFDDANSVKSMLADMGAAYIDDLGRPVPYEERNNKPQILIPDVGVIYTHGLKDEYAKWCAKNNKTNAVGNNHPTVKPVALMRYLIQLVTPPNSIVLDPFCGSGSTGMAARELGHTFVGCEQDPRYVTIAQRRIEGWLQKGIKNNYHRLFE